jgi:hypothetical protein
LIGYFRMINFYVHVVLAFFTELLANFSYNILKCIDFIFRALGSYC